MWKNEKFNLIGYLCGVDRFLTVDTRDILVLKLKRGTSVLPKLRDFWVLDLNTHPGKFRAVEVAVAPHAHLALSTIQTAAVGSGGGLSPLVHCELDSSFEGPIEVALDRRLFAFVTQALLLFCAMYRLAVINLLC